MRFFDEVTNFDSAGGPWGRGYLRATQAIAPDDWFFEGHFKNDPCMPGTLMFEGCLQMMAFYLAAMGYTLDRDGFRFEPVPESKGPAPLPRSSAAELARVGPMRSSSKRSTTAPSRHSTPTSSAPWMGSAPSTRAGWVSDWFPIGPLTSMPELLRDHHEPKPVARAGDFEFGYASLLACAWGKPSDAFGEMYRVFDGTRRVARLPGPPYHFMSRVTRTDGPIGVVEPGAIIEIEYDVPDVSEWYFRENGVATMPFCVFLEAALQPCGWLASYVGSACTTDQDLSFRNLDGKATIHREVFPTDGVFRTVVEITNISRSAGMIIESFRVRCYVDDELAYELDTVFGFFPHAALANQVGLPIGDVDRAQLEAPSDYFVDLRNEGRARDTLRLADPMLRMLDRVTAFDREGGVEGLGRLRAEKDVDPDEWFFKAHFFQDPVQPGSLGIEAMLQLLQFFMMEEGLGDDIADARFEPIAIGRTHEWKYRGQVVPTNELITTTMDIVAVGRDEEGAAYALADASLWVDGKRIYEAKRIGMRIVSGGARTTEPTPDPRKGVLEERLDPKADSWLGDHRPTFTVPALPMMSMVDRMLGVSGAQALCDVQVNRWLTIPEGGVDVRAVVDGDEVRIEAWREARDPKLSRFERIAEGRVRSDERAPVADFAGGPLGPLGPLEPVADPYASGSLFHGPSFQLLRKLELGPGGARAVLDAGHPTLVPYGKAHAALLDAMTHAIPHERMECWHADVPGISGKVAYPHRVESIRITSPPPREGEVVVWARPLPFGTDDEACRFPRTHLRAESKGQLLIDMVLREVLLPKGPLGEADPAARRDFLRDQREGTGVALCRADRADRASGEGVVLVKADVRGSDWLPGTIASAYGEGSRPDPVAIARKDEAAARAEDHPARVTLYDDGAIASSRPLTLLRQTCDEDDERVSVANEGEALDLRRVRDYWRDYFGLGSWPVEDLYYALLGRFVADVALESPARHAALRGRPVLYLANHQTGIESLLFSIVAGAIHGLPALTLAKAEHRHSWLGRLIQHCFTYPGARDPGVIAYFQRDDPASLPRIVSQLRAGIDGDAKSLLVHVEGTRSTTCSRPVERVGSAFVDLAVDAGLPIVPVRFAGGLPVEELRQRLDFPVGLGRQRILLGAPIEASDLAGLPLKPRVEHVRRALNTIAPEIPRAPSPPEALASIEREGVPTPYRVILDCLHAAAAAGTEIAPSLRALAAAIDLPEALHALDDDQWAQGLAQLFFGAGKGI